MDLPLFPLNTVLCPGVALPLHVFEPRYRAMVRHCLEQGARFGVVFIRDGREVGLRPRALAGVGTVAELRQVEVLPDGRLDLVAIGGSRFAIEHVRPTADGYLKADVSLLAEPIGDRAAAQQLAGRVVSRFARYVTLLGAAASNVGFAPAPAPRPPADPADAGHSPEPTDEGTASADALSIPRDPAQLSHLISGIVQVELTRRQQLLEAISAEERLAQLAVLLSRENALLARGLGPYLPDLRSLANVAN